MDVAGLIDEMAVQRVVAEYCQRMDAGRLDDVVGLFTTDGVFTFGRSEVAGHDDLRAWFAENQAPERRGKHLTTNVLVDIDGDAATVVSDFAFLAFDHGRLVPMVAGTYRDQLQRVDDRWLIRRREAWPLRPPG